MKHFLSYLVMVAVLCTACGKSQQELAQERLDSARTMVENNMLNSARLQIDSIHLLYPKQVDIRREAAALADTISVIEARRTIHYSDSLLQVLRPQADKLIKQFRHEKNALYENHGGYVHPLLATDNNTSRCLLKAIAGEDGSLCVKSFYCGSSQIQHHTVTLTCGEEQVDASGTPHCFHIENYHEILTADQQQSEAILTFISANIESRIKVSLTGKSTYHYYLQDNEKKALEQTYRLNVLIRDIRRLDEALTKAQRLIELKNKQS